MLKERSQIRHCEQLVCRYFDLRRKLSCKLGLTWISRKLGDKKQPCCTSLQTVLCICSLQHQIHFTSKNNVEGGKPLCLLQSRSSGLSAGGTRGSGGERRASRARCRAGDGGDGVPEEEVVVGDRLVRPVPRPLSPARGDITVWRCAAR